MIRIRRLGVGTIVTVLTVSVAYVLGVQAGSFINERKRSERRAKGVEQTRAILNYMQTIDTGDLLPDLSMSDTNGDVHLLSDLVTDRALISYIMTDCDACLMELEDISSICQTDQDANRFIFVSTTNPLHLRTLRENFDLDCRFLFDEERTFGNNLNINTYPFSMVVDD